jgi:hypothetical protein
MHLIVNLPCAQDNAEEQYADIDSEEKIKDNSLQDPSSSEENDENLECVPINFALGRYAPVCGRT